MSTSKVLLWTGEAVMCSSGVQVSVLVVGGAGTMRTETHQLAILTGVVSRVEDHVIQGTPISNV